jgi:hypothetical protein
LHEHTEYDTARILLIVGVLRYITLKSSVLASSVQLGVVRNTRFLQVQRPLVQEGCQYVVEGIPRPSGVVGKCGNIRWGTGWGTGWGSARVGTGG